MSLWISLNRLNSHSGFSFFQSVTSSIYWMPQYISSLFTSFVDDPISFQAVYSIQKGICNILGQEFNSWQFSNSSKHQTFLHLSEKLFILCWNKKLLWNSKKLITPMWIMKNMKAVIALLWVFAHLKLRCSFSAVRNIIIDDFPRYNFSFLQSMLIWRSPKQKY